MSNNINSQLFERAAECISYFEGKLPAKLIQKDLDNNDLESLFQHVKEAESVMFQLEYEDDDQMTPERAEAMYEEAENLRDSMREDGHVF